jgi:hypothetical protein
MLLSKGMSGSCRWPSVHALPGARRLIQHLRHHKVPLAIATSTSRVSFTAKMKSHPDLREAFQVGLHMLSADVLFTRAPRAKERGEEGVNGPCLNMPPRGQK